MESTRNVMKQLEVLYEDNLCIVINKPAGLPVQGGKGISVSLDSILMEYWPDRPLLVHRLDRDTSGIILAAKTKAAAAGFSRLFAGKGVIKQYHAICRGKPDKPEGTINHNLTIRGLEKKSETRFKLVSCCSGDNEYSLLELELASGRMHQIRRHLALAGNPVLGDDKYGDFHLNRSLCKTYKLKRLLLHACRLVIPQTPDSKRLEINAPLPEHFLQFMRVVDIPAAFFP